MWIESRFHLRHTDARVRIDSLGMWGNVMVWGMFRVLLFVLNSLRIAQHIVADLQQCRIPKEMTHAMYCAGVASETRERLETYLGGTTLKESSGNHQISQNWIVLLIRHDVKFLSWPLNISIAMPKRIVAPMKAKGVSKKYWEGGHNNPANQEYYTDYKVIQCEEPVTDLF